MKKIVLLIIFLCCYMFQFGQNECTDFVVSFSDFESKNILVTGTNDSLLKKLGEPLYVNVRDNFGVVDSIYKKDGKTKFRYYDVDVQFICFESIEYACYNDSVQLYWIDFSKTKDTLNLGNVSFYNGLDLDTLLKKCNMDTSCVTTSFDLHYLSNRILYQVAFYSKSIILLGFHFYFDMDSRTLWYAYFDLQKGDGIIR